VTGVQTCALPILLRTNQSKTANRQIEKIAKCVERIVKWAVASLNQKKKIAKRLQERINFNKNQGTCPIKASFFIP
jgi:hypothetical protein